MCTGQAWLIFNIQKKKTQKIISKFLADAPMYLDLSGPFPHRFIIVETDLTISNNHSHNGRQ